MVCPQKLTLLAKYQQEVREYAQSVSDLKGHTGIPLVEYMLLMKLAKHTLTTCQSAQRCLARHIQEHGC